MSQKIVSLTVEEAEALLVLLERSLEMLQLYGSDPAGNHDYLLENELRRITDRLKAQIEETKR